MGTRPDILEQPLSALMSVQRMVKHLAIGDVETAMGPVNEEHGEEGIREKLEGYVDLIGGREVLRVDCVDYERTGDIAYGGLGEEITYYEIWLENEEYLYARCVWVQEEGYCGIVEFEIFEECSW
ncbi:MAG: hypothetical protein IJ001_06760 [Oscillospiraceae bacterium]|nr:hypothetical protein [Oscillospiraceae bacterium]